MKSIVNQVLATAVVAATAFGATALTPISAEAKTYTKHEYQNKDRCYRVKKVPATVEYNTRGILVRESSRSWTGNFHKHGSKVVDKHHDPVYIQTKRVLEEQHTTLVPTSCH